MEIDCLTAPEPMIPGFGFAVGMFRLGVNSSAIGDRPSVRVGTVIGAT